MALYDFEILALGENRDGSPKHPLYIASDTVPVVWKPPKQHNRQITELSRQIVEEGSER